MKELRARPKYRSESDIHRQTDGLKCIACSVSSTLRQCSAASWAALAFPNDIKILIKNGCCIVITNKKVEAAEAGPALGLHL